MIRQTVGENVKNDYWSFIEVEGKSDVNPVMVGGEEHLSESILLRAEVYDN